VTEQRWRQVEQLYHAALERDAAGRAAFVREACGGDEELRQEVESLLAHDPGAEQLLETPALDVAAEMWAEAPLQTLVGRQIGYYQIVSLLGAGGMGEVYQARDIKLMRDVAIKVLPAAFVHHAERLPRFQREARMLAALNHPNIATIYGLEESGGMHYLVMELVQGATLAERIGKGPLPVKEALALAGQIAEALDAAHDRGVIHRDLKPANVKVTPEGRVKVLDFGLARAFARDGGQDVSEPTLTIATQAGRILGTPAYMSPEQARGRTVDKRTDIWAFGCVLYEMLTGEKLFQGTDVTETLAAVLKQEPDWNRVPAQVRKLMRRCLEKDPAKRLRGIGDAMELVEDAPAPSSDAAKPSRFGVIGWIAAGVLLVVAVVAAWLAYRGSRPAELKPLVRLEMDVGGDLRSSMGLGVGAVLSPDGTRLAYVAWDRLFTRRLDQSTATELAGTQGGYDPFFSPDGKWVGFFSGGGLKKIPVEGGAPMTLWNASSIGAGGAWGEDGNIIAALGLAGPLSRIPSAGGQPMPATQLSAGEVTHRFPQVLPGGKAVLYTAHTGVSGWDGATIEAMSFADHRVKTLQRGGTFARYVAASRGGGYLIYVNNATLFAAPFDPNVLELRGASVPVLERVPYVPAFGTAQLDISGAPGSGTLIYRSGGAGTNQLSTVQWLDPAGRAQPLLGKPGPYYTPRLSPDGRRLALTVREGSSVDIWIYDPQRDTMTRLTFGGSNQNPAWSPDGRYVVFEGGGGMYWARSDGASTPQQLTQFKGRQIPYSFTPDGAQLAYFTVGAGGNGLYTVPMKATGDGISAGTSEAFSKDSNVRRHPTFSPDGRWMAYSSNESGAYEIYVRAFPDKVGKWQISNAGGMYPAWSRNGHELFYRNDENRLMVAAYTAKGDSFNADKPRLYAQQQIPDPGFPGTTYDVGPDGRVAAIIRAGRAESEQSQDRLIFLENFLDELRRKVPANK
jgi:serine/threonine-protein kinase